MTPGTYVLFIGADLPRQRKGTTQTSHIRWETRKSAHSSGADVYLGRRGGLGHFVKQLRLAPVSCVLLGLSECMAKMSEAKKMLHTSSYWLVPKDPSSLLVSTIRELSEEFSTPIFSPHVTLHCVFEPTSVQDALLPALDHAHAKAGGTPITLTVSSIGHSEVRFKTLFLEFEHSEQLQHLANSLAIDLPSAYKFIPHLSLLYRENLSLSVRNELCTRLLGRFQKIKLEFDLVTLVSPGKDHRDFDIVEDWEIVRQLRL